MRDVRNFQGNDAGTMAKHENTTALYAALIGNLAIAITKFIAAFITGGSAMMSEGVHSLVDCGNEVLLLYGQKRAAKAPDAEHPVGYGRELYFWCFVVAMMIFALGAGISIYEGVIHILAPEPITQPMVNFIVFGLAFVFEGISLWFAWKAFRKVKGRRSIWQAVQRSKDPTSFTVLLEDSAAMIGVAIAAVGTGIAVVTENPVWDGASSIAIGVLLAGVAVVLARESKHLLVGEAANPEVVEALRSTVGKHPEVRRIVDLLTVQLGADQVFAAFTLEFPDEMTVPDLERLIGTIGAAVRKTHPEVRRIFVRPEPRTQETAS
ncbi:cation diffusion facilitator family transporter [Hoeflea sp. AS60]|uniref:cation diffusion facilitator family transporter n=1 Tax=Hoeflea sp. AS60 TaxID=3135780 RepID=UPI003170EA2E